MAADLSRGVVEVTGPRGTVTNLEVSPMRLLRAVFARFAPGRALNAPTANGDALVSDERQVGALRGDAIELAHTLTIAGGIRIDVEEHLGFIQDTFVFIIEAPSEQIDSVEAELYQAAHEAGLLRVRREGPR